jgi:anti-sigma regulatory factor (Ser/Thr protein kinase)
VGSREKVRSRSEQRFALSLPAAPDLFLALRGFLGQVLAARGLREQEIGQLTLVVQEAVTNIHRHAYRGAAGAVRLEALLGDDAIELRFEDGGPAFDPTTVPLRPLDSPAEGGRGIALIRALSDGLRYERRRGRNRLTVVKRRS